MKLVRSRTSTRFFIAVGATVLYFCLKGILLFLPSTFLRYVYDSEQRFASSIRFNNYFSEMFNSSEEFNVSSMSEGIGLHSKRINTSMTDAGYNCSHDFLGVSDYARRSLCDRSGEKSEKICQMLSCRNLLSGSVDDYHIGIAKHIMRERPKHIPPDKDFHGVDTDCEKFKRDNGYDRLKALSRDEDEFPIAFNILVHTGSSQVERLLRSIYRPHNLYCIHVDAKSSYEFQEAIRSIASCFDNVRLAFKTERVVYGGYSRLQADINCMRQNVNSTVPWKYLINTAGEAYPLRTMAEMVRILRIYNGSNDIEGIYGRRVEIIKHRFLYRWVEENAQNYVRETFLRNPMPPHDLDVVRGSAYGIFSRKFVEFVLEDPRAVDLLEWSKNVYSPDELYWSTLHHTYSNPHLRSPGGYAGEPNEKPWLAVYANWDIQKCGGKEAHGVCVFGIADLPDLVKRNEFFVNKFHQHFQPLAMDCLEAWRTQRELCPSAAEEPFDERFYLELPFINRKGTD